jgi:hypothetical protein
MMMRGKHRAAALCLSALLLCLQHNTSSAQVTPRPHTPLVVLTTRNSRHLRPSHHIDSLMKYQTVLQNKKLNKFSSFFFPREASAWFLKACFILPCFL